MKRRFSVVIVSLNGRDRIDMPVEAMRRAPAPPHEMIVVDNGSTDGLSQHLRETYPDVVLVKSPRNLGFAGGNNLGVLNATGDVVVLLNDDTEPETGWLEALDTVFDEYPKTGIVGCQLIYPDEKTVQHLGGKVLPNGLTDHEGWGEEAVAHEDALTLPPCDYVTGAAMAIRREVIAEVGLLDPGFWPIYFEEVDFCERARRARWDCRVSKAARVIHHESQTTVKYSQGFLDKYHRNRLRYLMKNRRLSEWPAVMKAEGAWLGRHAPWDSLWPCAKAYAWAPFQLAEVMRLRRQGVAL